MIVQEVLRPGLDGWMVLVENRRNETKHASPYLCQRTPPTALDMKQYPIHRIDFVSNRPVDHDNATIRIDDDADRRDEKNGK